MAASAQAKQMGSTAAAGGDAGLAEAEAKLRTLEASFEQLDSLMVAYSGGVDSAFLAATAHRVLGSRMLAVLADSPSPGPARLGAGLRLCPLARDAAAR